MRRVGGAAGDTNEGVILRVLGDGETALLVWPDGKPAVVLPGGATEILAL